jgi:PPOX class probable F420-dependent enzyme
MQHLVEDARVARLATVAPGGPDVVPITFALDGDRLVTAVDHKPKATRALKRLANIVIDPNVCVLIDHYTEDWTALWWCRLHGTATIHEAGATFDAACDALVEKYPQYEQRRPEGPVIAIDITRWTGWSATDR